MQLLKLLTHCDDHFFHFIINPRKFTHVYRIFITLCIVRFFHPQGGKSNDLKAKKYKQHIAVFVDNEGEKAQGG